MQAQLIEYIILIIIILLLVMLSQRLKIAYPIVLVVGGLLVSLFNVIPGVHIDPEFTLLIFLPPLLYEAAWNTSWKELWRWRRVISSFAFLVVIMTSTVVAYISDNAIPGFTLALGFLLGGIVSPPDAVSATSILKYVKVPRRVSSIIEGESLLNDASSLIVFKFAMAAVVTGRFVFHEAALNFVWVIAMGIATGIGVALVFFGLHRWLPTNANMDTILTLTAPYAMYIAAESLHFSGVLAVVSGGLFLAARSHRFLTYQSRMQAINFWSTIGFVLNGLVFMLIGLELPVIIRALGQVSFASAVGYGCLITGVLILTRMLSTLGASWFTVFMSRFIKTEDSRPGWRGPVVFGWAGMRGVVSLAAALSIPVYLPDHSPFPQRNLILFITFTVILLTLVVQGLTLPLLIRWVNLPDPDHYLSPEEQLKEIKKGLAETSVAFLQDHHADLLKGNESVQQLLSRFEHLQRVDDGDELREREQYRKVNLQLLAHQHEYLHKVNEEPGSDESVIRSYHNLLDIEEEKLRHRFGTEE